MHWKRECESWTSLNAVVYHDYEGAKGRSLIREHEFVHYTKAARRDARQHPIYGIYKFDVLITTYEIVQADWQELKKVPWALMVVDEGHRLKNSNQKNQNGLIHRLRQFNCDHKLMLTGTPLQNDTEELWSLLNFVEPIKFGDKNDFLEKFGKLKTAKQVSDLHEILKPHMLRRMKDDVEKAIPTKEETIIDVELTKMQKQYYRAVYEKNRKFLGLGTSNSPSLRNIMMELRKACNTPFLLTGVENRETIHLQSNEDRLHALVRSSGKLVLMVHPRHVSFGPQHA